MWLAQVDYMSQYGHVMKREDGDVLRRVLKLEEGGIRHILTAVLDIELSVGESREITALRRLGHHWPASYYSCRGHHCRTEPPLDKDTGRSAEYNCHGEVTGNGSKSTQRVRQHTKKPCRREKAGDSCQKIFGDTKPTSMT